MRNPLTRFLIMLKHEKSDPIGYNPSTAFYYFLRLDVGLVGRNLLKYPAYFI